MNNSESRHLKRVLNFRDLLVHGIMITCIASNLTAQDVEDIVTAYRKVAAAVCRQPEGAGRTNA
jgi:ribosomal protein L12E/L44/L45/RPP1/RPP2